MNLSLEQWYTLPMDIIAKTTAATAQLFDSMMEGKGTEIDSGDKPGETVATDAGKARCEFKMYTDVDSAPRQRGVLGGGRPLGQLVYTVVVTGEWVPFDDE